MVLGRAEKTGESAGQKRSDIPVGRPCVALEGCFEPLCVVHLVAVPGQYVFLNPCDMRLILRFIDGGTKMLCEMKARRYSGLSGFNECCDPLSGHRRAVRMYEQLGSLTAAVGDQQPVIKPSHGLGVGLILSSKATRRGIVVETTDRHTPSEAL